MNNFDCILFDLDGTLLDTAPDMGAALNRLLQEHNRTPLPMSDIRPHVSHGSRALVDLGFGVKPEDDEYPDLRQRFLDLYQEHLAVDTVMFPGIDRLLQWIEQQSLPWGIVTNKPGWLTDPLLMKIGLYTRSACNVSADTTSKAKPHPEPMFYACEKIGVDPKRCVYIGDAERDVEAGKSAGMETVVAAYGYLGIDENPHNWGADAVIEHPIALLDWLQTRLHVA